MGRQQIKIRRQTEFGTSNIPHKLIQYGTVNYAKDTSFWGHRVYGISANYTVNASLDGGATIVATGANTTHGIHITLPLVNAINGYSFKFYMGNTSPVYIVGDTNVIVSGIGATTKILNFGEGKLGTGVEVFSDGTKYFTRMYTSSKEYINAAVIYTTG